MLKQNSVLPGASAKDLWEIDNYIRVGFRGAKMFCLILLHFIYGKQNTKEGDTIEIVSVTWVPRFCSSCFMQGIRSSLLVPEARTSHTKTRNISCSSAKLIAENRIRLLLLQLWVVPITELAATGWFPEVEKTEE